MTVKGRPRLSVDRPQVEIQFRQAGSCDLIDSLRSSTLDIAFEAAVAGWEQLAVEDHVDFDPTWGVRPLVDAAFESRGMMRRVRFQVSDVHTLLEFVDRGLGVAIVPRHVSNKPQASRLITVALPHDAPRWEVSVVQSRKAGSDSAAPHLLELLADAPACR